MRPLSHVVALLVLPLPGTAAAAGVECRDLPALFRVFTQQHYTTRRIDDTVKQHAVDRFIEILDPSRNLLLAAEVAGLRQELPELFVDARDGDCRLLDQAWTLVERRAAEDGRIAAEVLTPAYELDESVRFVLDPDEREHARTADERRARARDAIHFQVSSYLAAGLDLDKAKRQLLHRYELAQKRISERRAEGELPNLWAQAFAEALDPHSAYMPPDELADFEIALKLSLEGIGAVLTSDDGFTVIQSLVPGGQAEKTKLLRPKDKIIAVAQDGEEPVSTIDMDLSDVVKMIRGKKGTRVSLTVLREGKTAKTFGVTIVRDKIDVSSQAAKITYETRKVGGRDYKIGIVELSSFYGGEKGGRSSFEDMRRRLAEARAAGVDGVVLDLSRNGGGLLDEAVKISGLFLKRGAVVGTKSADGKLAVLEDTDADVDWAGPLAVIVSRASASASEILAGALRDYRRALIVGGDRTFGKGTVQVVVPMPVEIGAIRVTTGMFFIPGGESTQRKGVPADVRVPTLFDGYDVGEDELDYALPAQAVNGFLSPEANGVVPGERWEPLAPTMIPELARRSKARVDGSAGFAKIREQAENVVKNKGAVRLSDLRARELKGNRKKNGEDDDDRFEALQQVVTGESVSVLADAIAAGWRGGVIAPGPPAAGPASVKRKPREGIGAREPRGGRE